MSCPGNHKRTWTGVKPLSIPHRCGLGLPSAARVREANYASRPGNVPKSSYTGTVLTSPQRRRIRVDSSQRQVQPVPSEPSTPEITSAAPKRRGRRMLVVLIVVAIIIIAGLATFFVLYLGSGSIFVTSNSQFIPAGGSTTFTATVTPPPFVSSTSMQWDFGDGNKQSSTGDTIAHTYANPGNYFVLSTASLSNGKTVDTAQGLFPIQVGAAPVTNPSPLGTTSALGALAFNKTLSSSGAPFIAVGGHMAFVGAVAQPPTFEWDNLVNAVANSWVNYTWTVTQLRVDGGDGTAPVTNASADPLPVTHTYATGGIFAATLQVTTGNFSAAQTNGTPANPTPTPTGATLTTTVGLTVAVGSYKEIKFSNGDAITAWDVKYSITRTMLFNSGSPFPPGWIISQFLVPTTFISGLTTPAGCSFGDPGCSLDPALTFSVADGAIEVNNASQEVTFHLTSPAPPLLFYQVVADPLGAAVMDHLWLESNGPRLVWNPAGFIDYEKYSALANYVPAWRNGAVGSGPYMIDYVANPDSVVLKPNPGFQVLPGLPAATVSKVVLQYVADASTRELSLESGQADIAGIPSAHFDVAKRLQGLGLIKIQFNPTLNLFWWNFNLEIYQS